MRRQKEAFSPPSLYGWPSLSGEPLLAWLLGILPFWFYFLDCSCSFCLSSSNPKKWLVPEEMLFALLSIFTHPCLFQPCSRFQVHVFVCMAPKSLSLAPTSLKSSHTDLSKCFLDIMSTPPTQNAQCNKSFPGFTTHFIICPSALSYADSKP